jgi:hypothetical protein
MQFDDYHRTIVGYHGTRLSVAREIVLNRRKFDPSGNKDDWLGHGIYFWEHAPQQALRWAERRAKAQNWNEPIAVVASMIRLGFCFDLLDPYNVRYLKTLYDRYVAAETALNRTIPKNANHRKFLDCSVFQFAYAAIESELQGAEVDTARAVYVPTDMKKRVWASSWIYEESHVQVCVRNAKCILGTWLHHPTEFEDDDAAEVPQVSPVVVESEDREGRSAVEADADDRSDPAPGQGGTPLPG